MPNQTSFSALQLGGATLAVIAATTVGYFMGNIQTTGTITSQNITATGAIAGQSLTGNVLHAEKTLTSSGTLVVNGNIFGRATMSGNVLHIEKGITGSGTLIIEGATNFVGGMSGASIVNSALGGHVNTLRCTKAGGVEGYIAVTASGTIAKSGGAISCQ